MSRSPKTVCFRVPGDSTSSGDCVSSPPPTISLNNSTLPQHKRNPQSPAPDLVADIINIPKVVHPIKVHDPQSPVLDHSPSIERPPSRPSSEITKVTKNSSPKTSASSYLRLAHRSARSGSGRDLSPASLQHQSKVKEPTLAVASVAREVREQADSLTHKHVRCIKQDVSQLQEHLLKVEEEIKNLNRGRSTLEISIQDSRKALSVNQQSISTQQKKSSRGEVDSSIKLLREESRVLSRGKRNIEQHLQAAKTHLQVLDTTRKNLKATISSLSASLEFDAQSFKVYNGPKPVQSDHKSRQRHYASGYQSKSPGEAAQLCSTAADVISSSKSIRAEIKSRVVFVQTSKAEAHKKITDTISKNMQEARATKRDMLLERGQVRKAQNSTLHRLHEEEIALGMALGPVSDKHRSVSERTERPLSRLRPGSAVDERENFKETRLKLTRQLSASSERASQVSSTDKRLAHQLREGSQSVFLDSQTLRVRKMSLDNRWVQ